MEIPYLNQAEYMDSFSVDDIGQLCISANNDDAQQWFLRIKTELGWTEIEEFGPLPIGSDYIGYSFSYYYFKQEFDEKKLYKVIKNFLNHEKRFITQAEEITEDIFEQKLHSVKKMY